MAAPLRGRWHLCGPLGLGKKSDPNNGERPHAHHAVKVRAHLLHLIALASHASYAVAYVCLIISGFDRNSDVRSFLFKLMALLFALLRSSWAE